MSVLSICELTVVFDIVANLHQAGLQTLVIHTTQTMKFYYIVMLNDLSLIEYMHAYGS